MKKLTEEQTNLMLEIEQLAKRNESTEIYEGILTFEIDNDFIAHKRFPTLISALIRKGYITKRIEKGYGEADSSVLCVNELT